MVEFIYVNEKNPLWKLKRENAYWKGLKRKDVDIVYLTKPDNKMYVSYSNELNTWHDH